MNQRRQNQPVTSNGREFSTGRSTYLSALFDSCLFRFGCVSVSKVARFHIPISCFLITNMDTRGNQYEHFGIHSRFNSTEFNDSEWLSPLFFLIEFITSFNSTWLQSSIVLLCETNDVGGKWWKENVYKMPVQIRRGPVIYLSQTTLSMPWASSRSGRWMHFVYM